MDIEKLFTLVTNYEASNFTLWNIYIAVSFGVITYSVGSERLKNLTIRLILAAGFLAFSFGNSNYLERNQTIINASISELALKMKSDNTISEAFKNSINEWKTMQPKSLRLMHYVLDGFIIMLILFGSYLISLTRKPSE
jgi:hypothetical protein